MTRRSFLAALASIPFLGRLAGPRVTHVEHYFNGKLIPFDVMEPSPEIREFYSGIQWPPNAIRYDGPEVFYKGLSLAERLEKARKVQ